MKHSNSPPTELSRMGKWRLWLALGLLVVGVLVACGQAVDTPSTPNAIPVDTVFADFIDRNGGQRVFGRPLTALYRERATGLEVQYFTRMRLERDAGGTVRIAPLGAWALAGLAPIEPEESGTPLAIDATYLDFYQSYAGTTLFGPPLSPMIQEGDLWVQYFQNARLEWHPELSRANRVQVGPLGTAHFYGTSAVAEYEVARDLQTVNLRAVAAEPLAVEASLSAPILFQGDQQVVYASVTTADGGRTVADAAVIAVLPTETVALGRTNADGVLAAPLPLPALNPGDSVSLEIQVLGDQGTVLSRTYLRFNVWW